MSSDIVFYRMIVIVSVLGLVSCSKYLYSDTFLPEVQNESSCNSDFSDDKYLVSVNEYYIVKKGDTLFSIAGRIGCDYHD